MFKQARKTREFSTLPYTSVESRHTNTTLNEGSSAMVPSVEDDSENASEDGGTYVDLKTPSPKREAPQLLPQDTTNISNRAYVPNHSVSNGNNQVHEETTLGHGGCDGYMKAAITPFSVSDENSKVSHGAYRDPYVGLSNLPQCGLPTQLSVNKAAASPLNKNKRLTYVELDLEDYNESTRSSGGNDLDNQLLSMTFENMIPLLQPVPAEEYGNNPPFFDHNPEELPEARN